MISPQIPADETSRLFALYSLRILGTAPDAAYDNIAEIARQFYKVPFAGVSFVDQDKVWLKTCHVSGQQEAPRAVSFCGHGILDEQATIINDTHDDERFLDNPAVSGQFLGDAGIRAYCGIPIHAPTGHRVGMLCLADTVPRDFTESALAPLKIMAETVEQLLAQHNNVMQACYLDALTGLPTNLALTDQISLALARAGKGTGSSADKNAKTDKHTVSLIHLNIDNFRFVNNGLGPATGDGLVRLIAQRLRPCVASKGILFKEPGDNFYVLCQNMSDVELDTLASELKQAIALPFFAGKEPLDLTASLGIASALSHGTSASDLMGMAELATQDAKKRGRNTVSVYQNTEQHEHLQQFEIYADLKRALIQHEFELYYQPTIQIATGRILALEALLRWNHPRLGLLYPADFIELAETTGLIVPIGEWVLHEACARAQVWRRGGLNAFVVSVNMSAVQFERGDLCHVIERALEHSGLPACYLEIELTESILVSENDTTRDIIKDLKQMGVRLAIDDFGTGYSNLSYLRKIAFDKIKIDQSFIRQMGADKESVVIVKAIKQLADSLGIDVVAEGVETEDELASLKAVGIGDVQGYLFARPAARDSCNQLIDQYLSSRRSVQAATARDGVVRVSVS